MLFGISLGYIMVGAVIFAATLAYSSNLSFAIVLLLLALGSAFSLGYIAYKTIREANCDYALEITSQDAVFSKIDNWSKKKTDQLLLLSDIKYAEYYPYQDSASIIFHTPYLDMDVPLWPMAEHAQDVLDFLEGAGIKIINVQSDESIPS